MSRKKKKSGCLTKVLFVMVIMAALGAGGDKEESATTQVNTNPATQTVEVVVTQEPTSAPTAAPTATPANREEWVQSKAEEVYGNELISVTWQEVDNQKDMIVIWCKMPDSFTNNLRRASFMGDVKSMMRHVAELGKAGYIEYGSCYIVGRATFLDTYGNEFDGNAMEIRLKEEDLAKINWENINNDMLVNLATTYAVHPLLRD